MKNASSRIREHEQSDRHQSAVVKLVTMESTRSRIDAELVEQLNIERQYWTSILQRVVEVIKFLSERGLAFRGSDELLGSSSNGNFLGLLELIAKFDSFLSVHIEKYKILQIEGKGRGSASYLSSIVCEELIAIMGK